MTRHGASAPLRAGSGWLGDLSRDPIDLGHVQSHGATRPVQVLKSSERLLAEASRPFANGPLWGLHIFGYFIVGMTCGCQQDDPAAQDLRADGAGRPHPDLEF